MRATIFLIILSAIGMTACSGGCDFNKMKDKAMEYKDKIPTDKIPTKLPK